MKAYKCEHCGEIVTPEEGGQVYTIKIKQTGMPEKFRSAVKCHVCSKCVEDLADFLQMEVRT